MGGSASWEELLSSEPILREWQTRINDWRGPKGGSPLEADDQAWSPFPFSAIVLNKQASAVDHMLAVRALCERAPHPLAPFTLLRTALIGASQAVWLLDATPLTRQARGAYFARTFGHDYRSYLREARKAEHLAYGGASIVLGRLLMRDRGLGWLSPTLPAVGSTSDTSIIRSSAKSVVGRANASEDVRRRWPHQAMALWRSMSGTAHSQAFAALAARSSEQVGGAGMSGSTAAFGVQAEPRVIGDSFHVVLHTCRHAWALFDELNVDRS